ncbi:TnsA-like heteromeric transposase endonuclease subunit [Kitasatospora sp. NPDC002040]|uniref:TnsA-like heteromeric transposase endonuclease subunit n=1 Tax=Kitasatospora sp. NPDC002040 TaxID=3154661 RepID=UPI0033205B03
MAKHRALHPIRLARDQVLVRYYDHGGRERLASLQEAGLLRFEDLPPAREIPSYAGQRHTPGRYWSASGNRMVGYESWLEGQWMRLLDFDPTVANFVSQPFILEGVDQDGHWLHVPDLFARRTDGTVMLVDVKADRFAATPRATRQRERTENACRTLGWDYQWVTEPDPLTIATVSWLAGYRRPLNAAAPLADPILDLARSPIPIGQLVSFQRAPEIARPVVYHLMWHHRLLFDATLPLRDTTLVRASPGGTR